MPPRVRIFGVVLMTFVGHTVAVWIYAGAYWLLVLRIGDETFAETPVTTFQDGLYLSVDTYTSLGFGDQVSTSHTRMIAGVEALNGLLLIGWSASFTYLAMERYWPLHGGKRTRRETSTVTASKDEVARARLFLPMPERSRVRGKVGDRGDPSRP